MHDTCVPTYLNSPPTYINSPPTFINSAATYINSPPTYIHTNSNNEINSYAKDRESAHTLGAPLNCLQLSNPCLLPCAFSNGFICGDVGYFLLYFMKIDYFLMQYILIRASHYSHPPISPSYHIPSKSTLSESFIRKGQAFEI